MYNDHEYNWGKKTRNFVVSFLKREKRIFYSSVNNMTISTHWDYQLRLPQILIFFKLSQAHMLTESENSMTDNLSERD